MNEILKVATSNLRNQKMRTGLTLLGIVIGIASVVALVSLGNSLQSSVSDQIEQLGADTILISSATFSGGGFGPPQGGGESLDERDLSRIRNVQGISMALPIIVKTLPVEYKHEVQLISIMAFPPDNADEFFSDVQNFNVEEGRFIKAGEKDTVIAGGKFVDGVYENNPKLRSRLIIKNNSVRIVGILELTGSTSDDYSLMTSTDTIRDIIDNPDEITFIMAKVNGDVAKAAEKVQRVVDKAHGENVFQVITTEQLIENINNIFSAMTIVLSGIAAISLLVAAFGIMNTMLMSVLERTKEIGIMKAIGATNNRVLTMFITESAIVGFIGGLIGVLIGVGFSFLLAQVSAGFFGFALVVTIQPSLIIFGIVFAVLVGALSGAYPARRASKLNPVDALRYE